MPQVTNHIIKRIYQELDDSYFTSDNFSLSFPDKGDLYFECRFIDNKSFLYQICTGIGSGEQYAVRYSPGNIHNTEKFDTSSFDKCISGLRTWTSNIRNELKASRIYGEFEEFKKTVTQEIDIKLQGVTGFFTKEEVAKISDAMDELTGKFSELYEKNEITKEELSRLRSTVNSLKEDARDFPRNTWYRTLGNKLTTITFKFFTSEQGHALLEESTKTLLNISVR